MSLLALGVDVHALGQVGGVGEHLEGERHVEVLLARCKAGIPGKALQGTCHGDFLKRQRVRGQCRRRRCRLHEKEGANCVALWA